MAIIRFSWDNLIWRPSTVFAGGTVDADWPLANLAEYHPSKKTRLTSMADSYVRANFVPPEPFDLVAILNHNASPYRNLLQFSGDVSGNPTKWSETNSSINATNVTDAALPGRVERFDNATAGVNVHTVQNDRTLAGYTTDRTAASNQTFIAECRLKQVAADQHASLSIFGSSGSVSVAVNLNDGTVNGSPSSSGNFSSPVATITSAGGFHKVVLAFTLGAAETSLSYRLRSLNTSFSQSFDSTAAWFYLSSPALYRVAASERYDLNNTAASAALWRVKRDEAVALIPTTATADDDSGWLHMAQSSNPKSLSDGLGSLSCYTVLTNRASAYLLFELHDPDNIVTDIDIGALWAGRSWQPTGSLQPGWRLFVDEDTGMLNLSGSLRYPTAADYYEDAVPLALNARVGTQARQLSPGGQEFWADSNPVLAIIDSDEPAHGQQQVIYGFLERWDLLHFSGPDQFIINFLLRGLRA